MPRGQREILFLASFTLAKSSCHRLGSETPILHFLEMDGPGASSLVKCTRKALTVLILKQTERARVRPSGSSYSLCEQDYLQTRQAALALGEESMLGNGGLWDKSQSEKAKPVWRANACSGSMLDLQG